MNNSPIGIKQVSESYVDGFFGATEEIYKHFFYPALHINCPKR